MAWTSNDFVPYGVNLGGWFCLEDWFYSRNEGSCVGHHVNTDEPTQKADHKLCTENFVADATIMLKLTQLEANQLARVHFGCESDLVNLLLESNISEDRVVDLFRGHRNKYIMPIDFARIRAFGIRRVRLPLTWCISYDTPYTISAKSWSGADTSVVIKPGSHVVEDPFTNDAAFDPAGMASPTDKWISIPCQVLEAILDTAASYGVEVLLDIHAFPGGSASGTFSGVWPLNPRFWSAHRELNLRTIMTKLYDWIETLASTNPRAFSALYGVTPMNEPAHMRGLVEVHGMSSYDLRGQPSWAQTVQTQDMLKTLAISVETFRNHTVLVENHKQLVMNVIPTAFPALFGGAVSKGVFGANASDKEGGAAVYHEISQWWKSITTVAERETWAVLDIHNYIAWDPGCSRMPDIKNESEFGALITELSTPFFSGLREDLDMPKPQRLACSEYSASTNRDTLLSITSGVGVIPAFFPGFSVQRVRDMFLVSQHKQASKQNIDMWFWTYHIRNNVNYQGEWSLLHILSPWHRLFGRVRSHSVASACREATHCIFHAMFCSSLFLLGALRNPFHSCLRQRLGLSFNF